MQDYIHSPLDIVHPTKDELVSLIRHLGHDYGNALTAINISLEMWGLGEIPPFQIIEEAHRLSYKSRHIAHIKGAVEYLGKNQVDSNDFRPKTVLDNLIGYVSGKIEQLSFRGFLDYDLDVHNSRDVIYMQLFNFTLNAIDSYRNNQGHIRSGGLVEIGTRTVRLTEEELEFLGRNKEQYSIDDIFIQAFVKDHGGGVKGKVKDAFKSRKTTKRYGSGVGLALTDYICDFVHGFVKVETAKDRGSTFSLYFPQVYKRKELRRGFVARARESLENMPAVGAVVGALKRK